MLSDLGSFSDRIDIITNSALRLNQILGEDFTSCDIKVTCMSNDTVFDGEVMDDIGAGSTMRKKIDRVFCTTGLGINKVAKENNRQKILFDTKVLLKPKVAVEYMLESISGSQSY